MTSWELGNDIMCSLVDKMKELSGECSKTNPVISRLLLDISLDFGTLVNDLMTDDDNTCPRMCPEHLVEDEESGEMMEVYTYFDGSSVFKKDKKR